MTTEKTTVDHTGKVLEFYEGDYNSAIRRYRSEAFPAIERVKQEYKALPFSESFTGEVLTDLVENGIKNVRARHEELTRKDLKSFKTSYVLDMALARIDEEMEPLRLAVENMAEVFTRSANFVSYTVYPSILFSEIKIETEKPVLDEEAVRRRFELRIETEAQNRLYTLLMDLKAAHDAINGFLSDRGYNFGRRSIIGELFNNNGLCYESREGTLIVNPEAINHA